MYRRSGLALYTEASMRPLKARLTQDLGGGRYRFRCNLDMGGCNHEEVCYSKSGFLLQAPSKSVANPTLIGQSARAALAQAAGEPTCQDVEGYQDSRGNGCSVYVSQRWCTPTLAEGPGWNPSWGLLWTRSTNSDGMSAPLACCGCGGGKLIFFATRSDQR